MSQVSQKELPDGFPIEFPMDQKGSHFHTPVEFPVQYGPGSLPLPAWNSSASSAAPQTGGALLNSGTFPEPWPSRASAGGVVEAISATPPTEKAVGEAISPIADAAMVDHSRGLKSPRQMTSPNSPTDTSPQQEQTASDWANRNSKRRLHDAPSSSSAMLGSMLSPTFSTPCFLPSSSSTPAGVAQQISGDQILSDAKYFVARMAQENENLGQRLQEEIFVAQQAVESQLKDGRASVQYRQDQMQGFATIAAGLKASYEEHMQMNLQKVEEYNNQRSVANQLLRQEMSP